MDEILRMITKDGTVTAMAITGRDLVERARQIHGTWPVATAALGRTLMATSMMGAMLKAEDGSVTVQIKGGGPLGTIVAVADCNGNPRGYVQNGAIDIARKYEGKLDVGTAVGTDGSITVMKDLGLKEPYIGSIELVSGEIAEDITAYFVLSEQIPTACALGVLVDGEGKVVNAGGYLVQLLPGAEDGVIDQLEAAVRDFGSVTTALANGMDAQTMVETLLAGMEPQLLERSPVAYQCYCSRERVSKALLSVGREELTEMMESGEDTKMTCQFCDAVYTFTKEDLEGLLAEA